MNPYSPKMRTGEGSAHLLYDACIKLHGLRKVTRVAEPQPGDSFSVCGEEYSLKASKKALLEFLKAVWGMAGCIHF